MSQITKKFVQDNAISGSKIRLDNNETLRARNAANSADINIIKVTAADKAELQVIPEMAAALPVPSSLKQLATVEYIQNFVNGKGDAKDSVSVLKTTDLALTGAVPLIIDDITVTNGMRIGLVGQSPATENGIYVATIAGTYTLVRATDADNDIDVTHGMHFLVTHGTEYAGYEALLTTSDPIVVDTTALTFVSYPSTLSQIAGDMLSKTGNTWTIDLAVSGGLESNNPGNVAGQIKVKVDTSLLEKDKTTKLDTIAGSVVAKKSKKSLFTISVGDVANQYIDLLDVAADSSVKLSVAGAGAQVETVDYTVNYTGGSGSKTRISFAGGLASAGASPLASGDVVVIDYMSF